MIISIWIILTIILGFFAYFYYKKNKFKLSKPKTSQKVEEKYKLFDSEKLLNNVTEKATKKQEININEEAILANNQEEVVKEIIPENKKNNKINFKDGVIASILLEKKV